MSDLELQDGFIEYGKVMRKLFILSILSIFLGTIAEILILIFLLISLRYIRKINKPLMNENLRKGNMFLNIAILIELLGIILMVLFAIFFSIFMMSIFSGTQMIPSSRGSIVFLKSVILTTLIISAIISFIARVYMIKGWENLLIFFRENTQMFSAQIGEDATKGSEYMKKSYIISIIPYIILLVFAIIFLAIPELLPNTFDYTVTELELLLTIIIIPILALSVLTIIELILQILGYWKLSQLENILV